MRLRAHDHSAAIRLRRGVPMIAAAAVAILGACTTQAMQPMQAAPMASSDGAAQTASMPTAGMPDAPIDAFDPPPAAASTATRADLAGLLNEGEAAYRARRNDAALAAFEKVVALDADQALAWLRIGNLHQQRRNWFKALGAYRRVAARSSGDGLDPALRAKALYNLAMINLELAQQTLRTLESIGPPAAAAGPREPLSAAVAAARRRLEAFASPDERAAVSGPAAAGSTGSRSEASTGTAAAAQTLAPAPRAPSRAVPSRAVPSREARARGEPEPELPRIDYIRGVPRP